MKKNMLYQDSSMFICRGNRLRVAGLILTTALLIAPALVNAQEGGSDERPAAAPVVVAAPLRALPKLLPDRLAGVKATGAARQFSGDKLVEIVGDKTAIYEEYQVAQAASRQYGNFRVDVFETRGQYAAYGLLLFNAGGNKTAAEPVGSNSAEVEGGVLFWKDNCFVRVTNANGKPSQAAHRAIARAVADSIQPRAEAIQRPALLGSLPEGRVAESERYFIGPVSLGSYLGSTGEIFRFIGDAEAVLAEYRKPDEAGVAGTKLVIAEYHTPQFATEAMASATAYVESLADEERNQIILKREGNFLVAAVNVADREYAQSLVDSIKYPYVVKWLQTPRGPAGDPLQAYKAAQLLVSVFTLLGLLLLSVLVIGSVVGTIIFFKRRKRQREVFSNGGDMLRLELDPFEAVILGLPPKRED